MSVSSAQKALLEEAVQAYAVQIDAAKDYLLGRGLTHHVAVIRRLGVVVDPLIGHEAYQGRLVIPYLTPSGVVDIRFRTMEQDTEAPKYMSRPGSEVRMFGVNAFTVDSDMIAVCEGEMDSIVLQDIVGVPAVGIPGANAWKGYYFRAFEDYKRVFVLADGDPAGREFAKKVAASVEAAVVIQMPDGADVNSTYLSEGAEGLRKRLGL